MPKCAYRVRPSDPENCGILASPGRSLCPRHEFMTELKAQKDEGKHQARAGGGIPRSRRGLLEAGYHFTGTATCKGCNQLVEWWRTKLNKAMPFDGMVHDDSHAVCHFATCSRANQFRRTG